MFVSIHSAVHNHFNFEKHINSRIRFKQKRDAALREWRDLHIALHLLVREYRRRVRIRLTQRIRPNGGYAPQAIKQYYTLWRILTFYTL